MVPNRKSISGTIFLISLCLFFFLYGNALAGLLHVPIPSLAFQWNIQNSTSGTSSYNENPQLSIQKIGLQTPIIPNVSVSDKGEYDQVLGGGVALAKGSSSLESFTGNSFIFGHSSNLSLSPNRYDTIFAGLPQLTQDDRIELLVAGRKTEYRVITSKVINPKDVQYLGDSEQRMVTLLTCWPLGTTYKRWMVQAIKI